MPIVWSDEISGVVIDAAFWWIGVEDPGSPVEKVAISVSRFPKSFGRSRSSRCSAKPARTASCTAALAPHAPGGFTSVAWPTRESSAPTISSPAATNHARWIAAGDMRLVRDIAELSPPDFRPPDEYETTLLCAAPSAPLSRPSSRGGASAPARPVRGLSRTATRILDFRSAERSSRETKERLPRRSRVS